MDTHVRTTAAPAGRVMVHDYFTIALVFGAIALTLYGCAYIIRTTRSLRTRRMTRRNDARLRGTVQSRVGVNRVHLPMHERPARED